MAISAQYWGECTRCEHPIVPENLIESDGGEGWRHVQCPADPAASLTTCPRCTARHPGEC